MEKTELSNEYLVYKEYPMRRTVQWIAVVASTLLALFVLGSPPALVASKLSLDSMSVAPVNSPNMSSQTMLIHFEPDTTEAERQNIIAEANGRIVDWIESINVAVVRMELDSGNDISGQSILYTSNAIEHVEADGWVYGAYESDDPDLYDPDRVYTAELLNMFEAWDYTTGDPNIVIAVLDTGIAFDHPEFVDKVLPGYDFFNRDDDPSDDHGHGTHVAGTSAAHIDNGIGAAGVCGECSILPIKVLNKNNAGTWSSVAAGVTYAADEGANIIVMSLGSIAGTKTIENAISYAVEQGVLVIAAAGNINSSRDFFPAAYPGVIGVAATVESDLRWSLSNYGDYVDVSAPGHLIYGAHKDLDNLYDGHLFMSGTSMATPHVAGLAGLLWSQDPTRSSQEIERLIMGTAIDLGNPGRDKYFGAGRIDPVSALAIGGSSLATAQISGVVWLDEDANGIQDSDEADQIPSALIELRELISDDIKIIRSNSQGFWKADELVAGNYRVRVLGQGYISTTPEVNIKLMDGESASNTNFGLVERLPEIVLGNIDARRTGSEIALSWQINSDLIDTVVVERAVDNGRYEVIGQEVVGTALIDTPSRSEFVDILPDSANDSTISYRFLVTPGDSYIDGAVVSPGDTTFTSFIPFLTK